MESGFVYLTGTIHTAIFIKVEDKKALKLQIAEEGPTIVQSSSNARQGPQRLM